ncbi:MAG TPA: MotA/TolQ/ExbB proton channel family protein [Chthoniobacterales bacterium]
MIISLRLSFFRSLLAALALAMTLTTGLAQTPAPAASAVSPSATPKEQLSAAAERSHREQQEVGRRFSSGWGQKLKEGGTTAIVQLALSVFGAMFIFERLFNLRRHKIVPRGLSQKALQLWRAGNFAALEAFEKTEPSTLGRAIAWVAKHRQSSYADVSVGAGDIISQEIEVNHQRAYPMGVVATLEPLLGLLGMILGMIDTFEVVALAGALGNPAQLAGGISEALVTTGLGLAVAIPFLALFHYFKSRTNVFGSQLEKEMTSLLSEWFLSPKKEEVYES